MDWNELRKRHPYLPETSDGYHQHANGGGWVIDTVTVSDDTMVGERALVLGGTIRGGTIGGGTIWGGTIRGGTIGGGTIWGGTIRGGTIWGGTIWGGTIRGGTIRGGTIGGGTIKGGTIWGGSIWGGTIRGGTIWGGTIRGGTIRGGTIWGGTIKGGTIWGGTIRGGTIWGGTIKGGTIDHTPLLIFGTQYWIGYAGDNLVASGCITKPLPWWLENIERCAEEYGYNEQQQKEYRMHIEHMAAWMRLYGYAEEPTDAAGQDSQPEEPQGAE